MARRLLAFLLLAIFAASSNAFVQPRAAGSISQSTAAPPSVTALFERQWNFNEGQSPWGLKKNAEIWNGRVSQMAFVWVFLQELITGKGVVQGIQEGDFFFVANAGLFGVSLLALTVWLAIKGDNDYTKE
ncbi:unnamed protein product [Cylindrotheca closterium]|uniref:Uncharacterized protein n=1 Tax=Cylindrotheca closterium TaxID=2856 RepID=A0AAD2JJR4_9STRA|nr:unnamed protein product [Cylindrotheca closterium]